MELYEDGAVLVDGFGQFYTVSPSGAPLDIPLPELDFGFDAMRAFEIQNDPVHGVGIFAVTGLGTLHTSGAADFFLTSEGVNRRGDLQIFENERGIPFGTINIFFDIIRDIEVWIIPSR